MPLLFFIDKDVLEDPACRNLDDIVLSYTFFKDTQIVFRARRNAQGQLEPMRLMMSYRRLKAGLMIEPSPLQSPPPNEHGQLVPDNKGKAPMSTPREMAPCPSSAPLLFRPPPRPSSYTRDTFRGPLVRRIERLPDGHQPMKDEDWRDVIWDMKEIEEASKQGKEVPPTYINVTDAFVQVLGSVTIPSSGGVPAQKYNNVVTLNTAGSNLILFSCPNAAALISWATALRLSSWEKSRLEEIYTAHLIRITLNDGRDAPSTLVRGRREGWVRIRVAGQTDWKHLWMTVSSGLPDSPAGGPPSILLTNAKGAYLPFLPKDRKKPFLTLQGVTQAFAVYPERPELINKSTLMKIEGKIGRDDAAMNMRGREGWVLVMPELEAGVPQANETIRWLIAFHDSFSLYGRPHAYTWDPRDKASMMFAYPAGPSRDSLFMDRDVAEVMDPRVDHTSVIRMRLNEMLFSRMQGLPASGSASSSSPRINGPTSPTQTVDASLPQLPPLGFSSLDPEAMRRTLTPIVESSPAERNPALPAIPGAPAANPPQRSDGPAPPSTEFRSGNQVPTSTSPAPVSSGSAYTPTDVSISPGRGRSEESNQIASVSKPNPEIDVSVVEGVSSERPSKDDGQTKGGTAASITSLPSSAASPPPLSPANSSNAPASVSSALAPPRTPSPKFSVLTSPHSMMDSPTRAMGAATATPSKLQQTISESAPPSQDGTLDIYGDSGAMFYIHHLRQGSLEVDTKAPPDSNGKDASSESEGVAGQFPLYAQPTVAPLRPRGSISPPPQQPTGIKHSQQPLSLDMSHRKPPIQQLPRTPTLDYGPERRPFGARDTSIQRGNTTTHPEDPDADALAALTFLEHNDDVPPAAPMPSSPTIRTPSQPQQTPTIVEPEEVRSPSPDSESASVYKSSFAPSKNAMQRKARSEAQQAAHEAATHRPGRGNGKAKGKAKATGAWGESSEEEEEEDDDDEDDDVDSDGQPAAPRDDRSVSNYAASANNHRSQYSSPRGPSPLASGDATSYQQPHPRPPRNLPPVPVRVQALDEDSSRYRQSDQYDTGRKSYHEDGVSHSAHGQIPTHAPAPVAPRHMWSQALDPGRAPGAVPDVPNPREPFVQLESSARAMTKAFTPHGLLSAGLQDKEDRSAKRQEELAREAGASLVNVPSKPPPPQTGLLGAITAHERDRKREGGVGATLTEREREKRLAEERQRKLDDLQRQQLEQMQQGGSLYGQQQFPGYNPMMNPMMMGMNPMMSGYMGYPPMMANYANPHVFAAQQAAQAYQQAMLSLSQAGSQIGGDGGTPAPMNPMMTGGGMGGASPAPLNPMMTGGGMGMGAFDPRFSMMGMPMMNPMGMGMGMAVLAA
ncbi:hypothetical protein EI94DRAFT_1703672 [Lactarius quietus]|nr:hypothetical protein EI94DRAFT_1703672 [Lactarius quietus]